MNSIKGGKLIENWNYPLIIFILFLISERIWVFFNISTGNSALTKEKIIHIYLRNTYFTSSISFISIIGGISQSGSASPFSSSARLLSLQLEWAAVFFVFLLIFPVIRLYFILLSEKSRICLVEIWLSVKWFSRILILENKASIPKF